MGKIDWKVRKMNNIKNEAELLQSSEDLKYIAPEYAEYEDAYTLAMDELYPVKYMVIGMTRPFPTYKNKRPPTKKHYIFEYVVSGKGHIYINDSWQTLESGCTYIIGKNDARNFYSDPKDPMHKLYVSFASEYIDSMMLHYGVESGVYNVNLEDCFKHIYETATSPTLSQKEKIFAVTESIHRIIMSVADAKNGSADSRMSRIEAELISSVYKKGSLDEIAEKFFMSKANLIRTFKQAKGITPYQFLLNEKIKIAKALFSTTDMSVKAVSERLGFADEHYFSHIFKIKAGVSALKYKAMKMNRSLI